MTQPLASLAVFAFAAAWTLTPAPASAQAVNSGHVAVELGAEGAAVPGRVLHLALRQRIQKGWHTYWRNPGDAGQPPTITWTLPTGWKAGAIVWPAPRRLPLPPLMDYGFEDEVLLPVPVTVPASARPGSTASLSAAVTLLVCEKICVPEMAQLALSVPVAASERPNGAWAPQIKRALQEAPRPGRLAAVMAVSGPSLKLALTGTDAAGARQAYFFPYRPDVIQHAAPQAVQRGPKGLTLILKARDAFKQGAPPTRLDGVVVMDGRSFEISARRGALPAGAAGPGAAAGPGRAGFSPGSGGGGLNLPLAAAFAFMGGIVLNLMPCVFPILSMKALAVARHAHDRSGARAEGLAFLLGVVVTFAALAGALMAARALGGEVGWGFQLQSPAVVAALALLMLLIGLNLSGVFEAGLVLQRAAGSAAAGDGRTGAFLTGALAVVVAAPCTAPFMAAAIAYALTQPPAAAMTVFLALGLGFAAPFTAIVMVPAILRRLPKPGAWMETLKKVLAFPMYGAAAWLLWVFTLQAGATAMAGLLAAAVATGLAAWLYGSGQMRRAEGRRSGVTFAATGAAALAAVALAAGGVTAPRASAAAGQSADASGLPNQPYSSETLASLQSQGRPVLVDFTAAWCVTCQVNERVALSGAGVAEAFRRANAVYLKADWTRRDPAIAEALAQHGRAGVPLYLVYPRSGGEPEVLGQVLSEPGVIAAIDRAAKS